MANGKPGRPATGQVPVRTVRVGPVWDEAKAVAKAERVRFADVIEVLLQGYVTKHGPRA